MPSTRSQITLPHIGEILMDKKNQISNRPRKQIPSTNITSNLPVDPSHDNQSIIGKESYDMHTFNEDIFFDKIQSMFCESEKRVALDVTQAMETRISTMESDIKLLRSAATASKVESDTINTRLLSLEKLANAMRLDIDQYKNQSDPPTHNRTTDTGNIMTNAIISGIPHRSEEDLKQIIATLFNTIGVKTEVHFAAFRLLKSASITTEKDGVNIPKILVKLNSIEDKKMVLELKRNKTILSTDLKVEGQQSKVYISEQLSTETGYLFKMARELRKFGIKYVWTNNGNVLVKSDSKAKTIRITHINDVIKLKSKFESCNL